MMKQQGAFIDFDGTLANTGKLSPGEMNVKRAYDGSVHDIFGPEGYEIYTQVLGGLGNRSPIEVTHYLLYGDIRNGDVRDEYTRQLLLENAGNAWMQLYSQLREAMPEGLGASFEWDPNEGVIPEEVIAETLVRQKLVQYLLPEIGRRFPDGNIWPEPFPGALEFLTELSNHHPQFEVHILSSGHAEFINRAFDVWRNHYGDSGLEIPELVMTDEERRSGKPGIHLLTEDTFRGYSTPSEARLRCKPGPLPFTLAYRNWRNSPQNQQTQDNFSISMDGSTYPLYVPALHDKQIMLIGDDPVKDGRQANIAGTFIWFNPGAKPIPSDMRGMSIQHWDELTQIMTDPEIQQSLSEGMLIGDVLRPHVQAPRVEGRPVYELR